MTKQRRWMQSAIASATSAEVTFPWARRKAVARSVVQASKPMLSPLAPVSYSPSAKIAAH